MKRLLSSILCLFLINSLDCPIFGQAINIEIEDDILIHSVVEESGISNPQSLPRWTPPPEEPQYLPNPSLTSKIKGFKQLPQNITTSSPVTLNNKTTFPSGNSGGSGINIAAITLGTSIPISILGGTLAMLILKHRSPLVLPPLPVSSNPKIPTISPNTDPLVPNYDFTFGEEIFYYLVFKNSDQTPIYPDTRMYVKIPYWLEYTPDTLTINNFKLTDQAGDDMFSLFNDESLLLINIGEVSEEENIIMTFRARVLSQSITKDEAFCQVKFQSPQNKFETNWHKLSVNPQNKIPSNMNNLLVTP